MKGAVKQHNTMTACDAIHFGNVLADVCAAVRMGRDEYKAVFFETGWLLVQHAWPGTPQYRQLVLQNERYGFWNWFYVEYLKDDELLLKCCNVRSHERYRALKETWAASAGTVESLISYYKNRRNGQQL
jgi:hypothetical protein